MEVEVGTEIKKCPFCGGEAGTFVQDIVYNIVEVRIICKKCQVDLSRLASPKAKDDCLEKLIEHWNRRVDDGESKNG